VVAALTDLDWLPITVLLVGALVATVVSVAYSYVVWRDDPEASGG
jgi:hypothetical protein